MLGRMSSRRDHPPLTLSHGDGVAVTYPREFARWPQTKVLLLTLRSRDCRGIIIRRAIALHKGDKLLIEPLLTLMPHQPPAEPLGKWQARNAL